MRPRRTHEAQGTGHAPTVAARNPGDQARPHGGHKKPKGKATPPRQPHEAQVNNQPTRQPHETQGTGHAPTVATRSPEDRPTTPPLRPHEAQEIGHAPKSGHTKR